MKDMNRKIGVGVLWNLASLFLTRGASTIFTLFLARLLAPEAFGLVAMATIVFELASVFINSGLGTALIRSKMVSEADLNTVFYTNLILSALAYVALYFTAPFVASFYNQFELTSLIQVMGLVVFINATKVVQGAVLTRKMDFKSQMKANTLSVAVSGCLAVTAAWNGWGVWSLVVQMLSSAFISALVLWLVSTWRPSLQFSKDSFVVLFRFGRSLLAEGVLQILFLNSYVLVIGRFFSAEMTGLYFLAKKLSNLVSQQLAGAVQGATFPALSTLQDDNETLLRKYRQIMQLMMFIIAPIMGLLAGLAPVMFELMFDERWSGAVPYLQLLCVVGALYPLHALNMNLLNVKGRPDLIFKVGLVKKSVNLAMLFMAIPFGVFGIVVSQVIAGFLALIPNTYFSARLLGYSLADQVKDVSKPLVSAGSAALTSWWAAQTEFSFLILTLTVSGIAGVVVYLAVSVVLKAEGARMIWLKLMNGVHRNRDYL
ncbi:lipopolysaccharide biosynthesis protein [uncultured Marinobacter sp.]|uniref:lipopolysaccharide biosynthesis protein n=1 Tax=uncultured Marinobacter sp. TaxID=187379 RepID=UPI00258A8473|nr:lipopolysaccharide biosynthesis protein [uncultured Marinobacter sp.]